MCNWSQGPGMASLKLTHVESNVWSCKTVRTDVLGTVWALLSTDSSGRTISMRVLLLQSPAKTKRAPLISTDVPRGRRTVPSCNTEGPLRLRRTYD